MKRVSKVIFHIENEMLRFVCVRKVWDIDYFILDLFTVLLLIIITVKILVPCLTMSGS